MKAIGFVLSNIFQEIKHIKKGGDYKFNKGQKVASSS